MRRLYWLMLTTSVLFLAGIYPQHAVAVTTGSQTGITVSPAFQQINLQMNEAEHTATFAITNDRTVSQTLDLSVADFNTLGESGGLFFVGTNPTAIQKKYGLAAWASVSASRITIPPKQIGVVRATITNSGSLTPGGHYGALMLSFANNSPGSMPQSSISIHPIASSLLFVTKLGGDTYRLALATVLAPHNLFTLPGVVTLRFHNAGNTHLVPRGIVTVSAGSRMVSKGIINENSEIVLPESVRAYSVPLSPVGKALWPGRHQLRVAFRFDGYQQFRFYQVSFIYIPLYWLAIPIILLLIALIVGLRRRGYSLRRVTNISKYSRSR